MLKTLEIDGFYDKGNDIYLDLSENLTILTGDNGAGKTTLLNIIFNILNGDFVTVNKTRFERILLTFNVEDIIANKKNSTQIVTSIEITKIGEGLKIRYFLKKGSFVIHLRKVNLPFADYTYDLIYPESSEGEEVNNFYQKINTNLSDLIRQHDELEFINLLKKNVIYFPTYRRIESDIIHLLEQNYPLSDELEVDLYQLNRTLNNFPHDRRVVGVNDNDIDHLFKNYSEKIRKLNSEGLNSVLKSFIEELIVSTYKNAGHRERKNNPPSDLYDKAPEQLIELSKQLGISNIKENEIKEYFKKQKEVAEASEGISVSLSIKGSKNETMVLPEVVLSSLLSIGENNNLIMTLINLYDQHMKRVNKELEAFEYLKKSFNSFFKGKISLDLNNYNIQLSRPFKHLSTGEKQLITILSYAALSLNRENYKPLIIIDEPELSLHISWQMKLLDTLLELPNINILLATHSPYIANSDYEDYIWQIGEIDEY
ncbi:MAG TPA: AAA family ATPase [Anoxybacillus sp.]|nr:AAA family ATPase [Anoxybacillus sp.]